MATINFNAAEVEPSQEFQVLPEGKYETVERILARKPKTLRELNEAWFGTYIPHPMHYDGHRYYVESVIMLSIL